MTISALAKIPHSGLSVKRSVSGTSVTSNINRGRSDVNEDMSDVILQGKTPFGLYTGTYGCVGLICERN